MTMPIDPEHELPLTVRALHPAVPDPQWYAARMWKQLKRYQPAVAGALALLIQELGDEWPQREFNAPRADTVIAAPPRVLSGYDFEPEIAPYRTTDADNCHACDEAEDQCRWHRGFSEADGDWFRRLLKARKANPNVTVAEVMEQYEQEEHELCGCAEYCTSEQAT
jgi:hypothetical protein